MEVTIKGAPKEIAALALELQGRPKECDTNSVINKQIDLVSKASEYCAGCYESKGLSLLTHSLIELLRL